MKNLRLVAALVIDEVTNGRSLSDALPPALANLTDARDRALVQSICYGVCRFYTRLDVVLSQLLEKPLKAKDSDVHALLLVGLFQLMEMRIPPHAAVAETVDAVESLNKSWARGFVNAILRRYLREADAISETVSKDEEGHFAHPYWWISAVQKAWPQDWQAILEANNAHPPFSLRVNSQQFSRDEYLQLLKDQGIVAHAIEHTDEGLLLETAASVETLPRFNQGAVTVQDGAAQLATSLLELKPGLRVLDACAAPGGKFTHILEKEPQLSFAAAVEKDPARAKTIQENLQRLNLQDEANIKIICDDATHTEKWWDGKLFDRILLDAPCSASGVIRRHPDIKLLRQPQDISPLSHLQRQLLEALWPLLTPGGLFVYATCSILHQENSNVIHDFCITHPDAKEKVISAEWGKAKQYGRQILPGMYNMDGFYYCVLVKEAT